MGHNAPVVRARYHTMAAAELSAEFSVWGLEGALKQLAAKPALVAPLREALAATGLAAGGAPKNVGNLIFTMVSGLSEARAPLRPFLSRAIGSGALRTVDQVRAALDFAEREGGRGEVDAAAFEAACGVGVAFSQAQLEERARDVLASGGPAVPALRYAFPLHTLQPRMKEGKWRWAEGKALNDAWNAAVKALLGEKTPGDEAFVALAKKEKAAAVPQLVELLKRHAAGGAALGDGAKAALAALAAEGGGE